MMSEKEYYRCLYRNLLSKNQKQFDEMLAWRENYCIPQMKSKEFENLMDLLDIIERRYGFNLQKQCEVNYILLSLWRKESHHLWEKENHFRQEQDSRISPESDLFIGLKFLLAGCLLDKILDSRRFDISSKQSADRKMSSDYIQNYLNDPEEPFPEINHLLAESVAGIYSLEFFFQKRRKQESFIQERNLIINKLEKAYVSEKFVWKMDLAHVINQENNECLFQLLTNKSIEFESIALLMSSIGEEFEKKILLADLIGEICWLSDDLFDFVEDIKNQRVNSLLYFPGLNTSNVGINTKLDIRQRVELVFENQKYFILEIENRLARLRSLVDTDLYLFLLNHKVIFDYLFKSSYMPV